MAHVDFEEVVTTSAEEAEFTVLDADDYTAVSGGEGGAYVVQNGSALRA